MKNKKHEVNHEDNIRLMCQMFEDDTNRFLESLPKVLSQKEINKRLFLYRYENDFSEDEKQKILQYIDRLERT